MVLALFHSGRLSYHKVSSEFMKDICFDSPIWDTIEDVCPSKDGFRWYLDCENMMLYYLHCTPRVHKVCHECFDELDFVDGNLLRFRNRVLLRYITRND